MQHPSIPTTPPGLRARQAVDEQASLNALIFRKLMPLLVLAYVISFIDRTNIALAKSHMAVDIGISAAAYGLGAGLFFLSYALLEVPSNLVMHRVGARWWIARIMITWGLLSAGMAFVTGETSFYVMRILLGAAEAGLFPGVMLYLNYWFGRKDRARATGYFLLGVCIANILSGPVGGALLQMDGLWGWHGWQWMFVLEGLPAVALAFVVWRKLPDGPSSASWLTRPQAQAIERQLTAERAEDVANGQVGESFRACLVDRQIWLAIFVYFCHQISIYTVIFFLPSIIGTYGKLSPLEIGALNSLPWVAAAVGAIALPRLAVTPQRGRLLLLVGLVSMAVGLLIAAFASPAIALAGFCLTGSMFFVVQSVIFLFASSRLAGVALAGGLALVNTCGLVGGFIGPSVMGWIEQSTGSTKNGLLLIAGMLVAAALASVWMRQGQESKR
ncbi:MFS family permease [Variovorax boronicumulans]|uniref:MFS family permease n=1 Tax=Variovorax boronicumulans TaxID=436515 RepID=A0AAW8DQP2_9BURK|nr:MFS transporter [Variovorax boronicumulans]MDP9876411.1 MFS family permease [Variovorax boronicumulans]MDP9921695.1 MFS family permease [Variovorax boronicumulans]